MNIKYYDYLTKVSFTYIYSLNRYVITINLNK